jgi:DNA-binding transcriptional LysR family regulator
MDLSMNLHWFKDLEALQLTGHFSAAAQKSNISQPALSRRIKALEDWAGFVLVDRSSRPVRLTSAGTQLLDIALSSFQRLADEREALRQSDPKEHSFAVKFAAQHSIAWRFFPNWLQDFENSFGPIVSRVRADDLPDCIASFVNGEVDFLIAYNNPLVDHGVAPGSFKTLCIGSDRLIPVSKPDAAGAPLFSLDSAPQTLLPYIGFSPTSSLGKLFAAKMMRRAGAGRLKPVYENSMVGALRVRAWNGSGISWLPESLVSQDVNNGLLCRGGGHKWDIDLKINLFRLSNNAAPQLGQIWQRLMHHQPTATVSPAATGDPHVI